MMSIVTRLDPATWLRRFKVTGMLVLIGGTVALLAHVAAVSPRLLHRPPGNHQELRRAPDEPSPQPDAGRKRTVRIRPVIA